MNIANIRCSAFAMPLTSPAFPPAPYRFIRREHLVISDETDPDALPAVVPEPLQLVASVVKYEVICMPDPTGFGDYTELAQPNDQFKIIAQVHGRARICELVRYRMTDLTLHGAWSGPVALELHPHALAPVAELPVRKVVSALHCVADLTLELGEVASDALAPEKKADSRAGQGAGHQCSRRDQERDAQGDG